MVEEDGGRRGCVTVPLEGRLEVFGGVRRGGRVVKVMRQGSRRGGVGTGRRNGAQFRFPLSMYWRCRAAEQRKRVNSESKRRVIAPPNPFAVHHTRRTPQIASWTPADS